MSRLVLRAVAKVPSRKPEQLYPNAQHTVGWHAADRRAERDACDLVLEAGTQPRARSNLEPLGKADAGIEPAEEGGARKPAILKPAEIVTCAKKQGVLVAPDFDPTIAAARASLLYGNVILRVLGA
jgi:hypothetical protein